LGAQSKTESPFKSELLRADTSSVDESLPAENTVLRAKRVRVEHKSPMLHVLSFLHLAIIASFISDWWNKSASDLRFTDYPAFLTGWKMMVTGQSGQLYDLAAQAKVQHALINGSFKNDVLPFNYPPYIATIFGGLGRISLTTGYWIWAATNVALAGVLLLLMRRITRLVGSEWKRYALWVLAVAPLWAAFIGGVFSLWITVGVAGFVLATLEGRQFSAGIWLGLVAFKPQYLPVLIVFMITRRMWRALAGAATIGVTLFAISLPTLGVEGWRRFLSLLQKFSGNGSRMNAHAELMWSVRGAVTRLVEEGTLYAASDDRWLALSHDKLTEKISYALFGIGLVCVAALGRKINLRIHLALAICAMVIVSPHGHSHDTLLMVIAVGLAWSVARNQLNVHHGEVESIHAGSTAENRSGVPLAQKTQIALMVSALPMYAAFTVLRSSLSLLPLLAYCAMAGWAWGHRHDAELESLAKAPFTSVLAKEQAIS
jgi:Glycosyltransferase family 87